MRRTKAEADETRSHIVDAAELMFFQRGVSATTLDQIAKAAGVTRGAVYWHFADKEALLSEIYSAVALPYDSLARLECEVASHDPFGVIERAVLEGIRSFASDIRQQRVYAILSRIGLLDSAAKGAEDRLQAAYDQQREQLLAILTLAQQQGLMSPIWTPASAEGVLSRWLWGLYQDWMTNNQSFDLVSAAGDQISRLISSFRVAAGKAQRDRVG